MEPQKPAPFFLFFSSLLVADWLIVVPRHSVCFTVPVNTARRFLRLLSGFFSSHRVGMSHVSCTYHPLSPFSSPLPSPFPHTSFLRLSVCLSVLKGRVKLADFGLVKGLDDKGKNAANANTNTNTDGKGNDAAEGMYNVG